MKSKKIYAGILAVCVMLAGCADKNNTEVMENPEQQTNDESENAATGTMHISETIMENFVVDTDMTIPEGEFYSYTTESKQFDKEKVAEIMWPDSNMDEIQMDFDETGTGTMEFQGEFIAMNRGLLWYFKDKKAQEIDGIVSFADRDNMLTSKDLAFMKQEQAVKEVGSFLEQFELGTNLEEPVIYAVTKEELAYIQNEMLKDEHYEGLLEIGKVTEYAFDDNDEFYYIKYTFQLDGLPVFRPDDPSLLLLGGVDALPLAYPMEINVLFSNSGIQFMELDEVVGDIQKETEAREIIKYEQIKEALVKKYGDVILTNKYKVTSMWVEYLPMRAPESFVQIELLPVWCRRLEESPLESDQYQESYYALRFNAFTGEEIA